MGWLAADRARLRSVNVVDSMALLRRSAWQRAGGYAEDPSLSGWQDFALWCALEEHYAQIDDPKIDHLDGLTVDYGSWWFNLRPSNTEPLLRLNVEASDRETLERERAIGPYTGVRDFVARTGLGEQVVERLIAIGAFDWTDTPRRELLWQLRTTMEDANPARPALGLTDDAGWPRVRPVTSAMGAGSDWSAVDQKPQHRPGAGLARARWHRARPCCRAPRSNGPTPGTTRAPQPAAATPPWPRCRRTP